jgi:hypothetical protein
MAGEGRFWPRPDHYPIATRVLEFANHWKIARVHLGSGPRGGTFKSSHPTNSQFEERPDSQQIRLFVFSPALFPKVGGSLGFSPSDRRRPFTINIKKCLRVAPRGDSAGSSRRPESKQIATLRYPMVPARASAER